MDGKTYSIFAQTSEEDIMKYTDKIKMKNGQECTIRNATYEDGQEVSELYAKVHGETDYLLAYSDEHAFDVEGESEFLRGREESGRDIMLLAVVDGKIVANAGISGIGNKDKVKHRAEFGISVEKEYWGLGIGRNLMNVCVECAKKAGYKQLELEVVADNAKACEMYKSAGFVEYGRNPKGFLSRYSGYQEVVSMRLEL